MSRGYKYTEDERNLFARFAGQLIAGRYENAGDAARACLREHERRRSRLAVPPPQRPLNGIQQAITKTAHELGAPPRIDDWTPAELRIVKRCARGVANGRYKRLIDAVRECRAKLGGRHTPHSTHARICRHAAELGWQGVFKMWNKEENRIADRFAVAVNGGEYPRCAAATDDCMRALKAAGMPVRTRVDVFQKLVRRTLSLGRELKYTHWNNEELAVVEPYARKLAAGEYHSGDVAARECRKALVRAGFRSHTFFGVRLRVLRAARTLGRRDVHLAWTDREMARIEGVARDYAAGKYPNIVAATEDAIRRLRDTRTDRQRKYSSVAPKVLARAHELGRPNYWRLWSDAENRRCDAWIRWYEKHRHVRRYKPAQEAVLGLQEELERLGIDRTRGACSTYFYKRRKLLRGGPRRQAPYLITSPRASRGRARLI
jgi:Arc/MetJ-type ribon-helix-helix transcriptional regulator